VWQAILESGRKVSAEVASAKSAKHESTDPLGEPRGMWKHGAR
jgi:hypothetical protein